MSAPNKQKRGTIGVTFYRRTAMWQVQRRIDGVLAHFGAWPSQIEACIQHDMALIKRKGWSRAREMTINLDLGVHNDSRVTELEGYEPEDTASGDGGGASGSHDGSWMGGEGGREGQDADGLGLQEANSGKRKGRGNRLAEFMEAERHGWAVTPDPNSGRRPRGGGAAGAGASGAAAAAAAAATPASGSGKGGKGKGKSQGQGQGAAGGKAKQPKQAAGGGAASAAAAAAAAGKAPTPRGGPGSGYAAAARSPPLGYRPELRPPPIPGLELHGRAPGHLIGMPPGQPAPDHYGLGYTPGAAPPGPAMLAVAAVATQKRPSGGGGNGSSGGGGSGMGGPRSSRLGSGTGGKVRPLPSVGGDGGGGGDRETVGGGEDPGHEGSMSGSLGGGGGAGVAKRRRVAEPDSFNQEEEGGGLQDGAPGMDLGPGDGISRQGPGPGQGRDGGPGGGGGGGGGADAGGIRGVDVWRGHGTMGVGEGTPRSPELMGGGRTWGAAPARRGDPGVRRLGGSESVPSPFKPAEFEVAATLAGVGSSKLGFPLSNIGNHSHGQAIASCGAMSDWGPDSDAFAMVKTSGGPGGAPQFPPLKATVLRDGGPFPLAGMGTFSAYQQGLNGGKGVVKPAVVSMPGLFGLGEGIPLFGAPPSNGFGTQFKPSFGGYGQALAPSPLSRTLETSSLPNPLRTANGGYGSLASPNPLLRSASFPTRDILHMSDRAGPQHRIVDPSHAQTLHGQRGPPVPSGAERGGAAAGEPGPAGFGSGTGQAAAPGAEARPAFLGLAHAEAFAPRPANSFELGAERVRAAAAAAVESGDATSPYRMASGPPVAVSVSAAAHVSVERPEPGEAEAELGAEAAVERPDPDERPDLGDDSPRMDLNQAGGDRSNRPLIATWDGPGGGEGEAEAGRGPSATPPVASQRNSSFPCSPMATPGPCGPDGDALEEGPDRSQNVTPAGLQSERDPGGQANLQLVPATAEASLALEEAAEAQTPGPGLIYASAQCPLDGPGLGLGMGMSYQSPVDPTSGFGGGAGGANPYPTVMPMSAQVLTTPAIGENPWGTLPQLQPGQGAASLFPRGDDAAGAAMPPAAFSAQIQAQAQAYAHAAAAAAFRAATGGGGGADLHGEYVGAAFWGGGLGAGSGSVANPSSQGHASV